MKLIIVERSNKIAVQSFIGSKQSLYPCNHNLSICSIFPPRYCCSPAPEGIRSHLQRMHFYQQVTFLCVDSKATRCGDRFLVTC